MRRTVVTSSVITSAVVFAVALTGSTASAHEGHNHGDGPVVTSPTVSTLTPIADSCDDDALAGLELHNGFQSDKSQCVDTQFGATTDFNRNPTLLITKAPLVVRKGQNIVLKVSTQNLLRDKFLAAGDGGYYIESATLDGNGFTRGHFHTGCRRLDDRRNAPEPFRLNADGTNRFVATEDSKGGDRPDTVTVTIPGFDKSGVVQCAAWAGDGSHRIPMMSFANEIPAFDAVRVIVR